MKSKKILIFIDWYKPGYKAGGPIRSISNMVDYLHEEIDISIITNNTDYLETIPYSNVDANKWQLVDNANVYYLSKNNINYSVIKKLITEVKPHIIYCNSLYSPYFTLIPLYLANRLKIKSILAVRGMLSEGSFSVKNKKKKAFMVVSKALGIFKKCVFHATNESEKNDIINAFGKDVGVVITQNLPEKKELGYSYKKKETHTLKLVSVGRIAPEKNTLYAIEILNQVKSKVEFDIYGPIYDTNYWNKCQQVINQLPSNIVVNYKKSLPHNQLQPTLQEYHVLLLPSTGENFGHIIIEAMMNSCVPIISEKTPWKGLENKGVGFDISLKNRKLFSETIDLLANMNEEDFNKMLSQANKYAIKVLNNKEIIQDYYNLFQLKN